MTDTRTDEEVLCEFMEPGANEPGANEHTDSDFSWRGQIWSNGVRRIFPRTLDLERSVGEILDAAIYVGSHVAWQSSRFRHPEDQGTGYRGEGESMSDQMWWAAWASALFASACDWDWRKIALILLSFAVVVYGRMREAIR